MSQAVSLADELPWIGFLREVSIAYDDGLAHALVFSISAFDVPWVVV